MSKVYIFLNTYDGSLDQKVNGRLKEKENIKHKLHKNEQTARATSTSGINEKLQGNVNMTTDFCVLVFPVGLMRNVCYVTKL
jgi:hypothetical protein